MFYFSIWSVLSGSRGPNVSGVVLHDMRQIEQWISHLVSCPVPTPGKHKVTLELLPPELQVPLSIVFYPLFAQLMPLSCSFLDHILCQNNVC